jgi:hypothetical protein
MRCEEIKGESKVFMIIFDMESAMPNRPCRARSATEIMEALVKNYPSMANAVKHIHLIN